MILTGFAGFKRSASAWQIQVVMGLHLDVAFVDCLNSGCRPTQDRHCPSALFWDYRAVGFTAIIVLAPPLQGAPYDKIYKVIVAALGALVLAAAGGAAFAQKTQLLVYTALETDQIKAYADSFNKIYPDIEIKWVRDSTGVITAKLLAEKANPQADVVMGVAASSLALLDAKGMLEPYAPLNLDAIMSQYRDTKNPPAWVGMDVWGATVCFNTVEAQKKNLPKPETWKDLTKPVYKGQIVDAEPGLVAAPASSTSPPGSRSGATTTARAAAGSTWTRCTRTSRSTRTRAPSPATMAGAGEFVIGISFEYRATANKAKGAPIDLVFPKEGLGWDLEAFGILKGTKKLEAAKKLADWAVEQGRDAAVRQELRDHRACPACAEPLPNVPADYEKRLVKKTSTGRPKNRERILAEWTQALQRQEPKK